MERRRLWQVREMKEKSFTRDRVGDEKEKEIY